MGTMKNGMNLYADFTTGAQPTQNTNTTLYKLKYVIETSVSEKVYKCHCSGRYAGNVIPWAKDVT